MKRVNVKRLIFILALAVLMMAMAACKGEPDRKSVV